MHINIKKMQAQQTRSYNERNCAGEPFEISQCVLKINKEACLSKLKRHYNGPYTIIGKCSTGYYICDKYSHTLSRAIVSRQLVKFYKKVKDPKLKESEPESSDSSDKDNMSGCR